ncbi:MAG: penicillin-binding protein 2B [Erysipelotrichaceae bacterium]|nr:MAG: penicillin-binding protein [Erysipelotrichaceae bacterium]TXT18926.1 MAG: penicillin-binding protein 2B [Erysipelotrichaceae bacterium]
MKNRSNTMLLFSTSIIGIVTLLVVANLFSVSILGYHMHSNTDLKDYSNNINLSTSIINANRGTIYDRDMNILAEDVVSYTLYAIVDETRPAVDGHQAYVSDYDKTATELSKILGTSKSYILDRLDQAEYQTEFGAFGRQLSSATKAQIVALNLPGLGFIDTQKRTYPLDSFGSYLLGFANDDDQTLETDLKGRMGLESSLDDWLKGVNGHQISTVDSQGYVLPGSKQTIKEAENGNSVVLTIDRTLQNQLELTMKDTEALLNATQVWGSIVEVKTGKILAFGQNQNFDLNKVNTDNFMTFGSQLTYEPGSTMKTFTYAIAIEEGVYNGKALYDSSRFIYGYNNGKLTRLTSAANKIGVINNFNFRDYGLINYDTGYALSSNVGIASLLTTSLDPEIFKKYLNGFHFFEKVDTDIQPESLATQSIQTTADLLHVGFGQGISVNMLQLVQAYTAIMNKGTMMKPYVVDRIINPDTKEVLVQNQPIIVGTPISSTTADQMVDLMRYVVTYETGSCKRYAVDTVDIICKSGTAQLVVNGTYADDEFIYSVAIGLPYDDPEILVYYAFRSKTNNTTEMGRQVRELIKTIDFYTLSEETVDDEVVSSFVLPSFINHSPDFVKQLLKQQINPLIIMGNGKSIINQYPSANTMILSSQRIILLSSYEHLQMPDMMGWSKKDVLAFFRIINQSVSVEGEGYVSSQSLPMGSTIVDGEVTFIVLSR